MDELFKIVSRMNPEEALAEITRALERLLADLYTAFCKARVILERSNFPDFKTQTGRKVIG